MQCFLQVSDPVCQPYPKSSRRSKHNPTIIRYFFGGYPHLQPYSRRTNPGLTWQRIGLCLPKRATRQTIRNDTIQYDTTILPYYHSTILRYYLHTLCTMTVILHNIPTVQSKLVHDMFHNPKHHTKYSWNKQGLTNIGITSTFSV